MTGERARSRVESTRFADVRWIPETASTNTDLVQLARDGAVEGVVLVADHQTGGRGRLGRIWQAPPASSLLCSILCRPALAVDRMFLVTMALGVAAAEACVEVAGVVPRLKWPNDLVLVADSGEVRKLGGMLSESVVEAGELEALILGIGINVNWPIDLPSELKDTAVALNTVVGHDVDREGLLAAMLVGFDQLYGTVAAGSDGATVQARYREHSVTLGSDVRVETAVETIEGRAVDLADDGSLVVEQTDGRRQVVTTGDVTHLRPT